MIYNKNIICPHCNSIVTVQREGVNHAVHGVATILTGGLWAVVWLVMILQSLGQEPVECPNCKENFLV